MASTPANCTCQRRAILLQTMEVQVFWDAHTHSKPYTIRVRLVTPHEEGCPAACLSQDRIENVEDLTVPRPMPDVIRDSHRLLEADPHNWVEVERLASLHEARDWQTHMAPYIRLRRVRNALAIALRTQGRESIRAAAEWYYRKKAWTFTGQKRKKVWNPLGNEPAGAEVDAASSSLYNLHAQWASQCVRCAHAAWSMYYDHAEYWPSLVTTHELLPIALMSAVPNSHQRLTEEGTAFDKELLEAAKKLVQRPWQLHYEIPASDRAIIGELPHEDIVDDVKDFAEKFYPESPPPDTNKIRAVFSIKQPVSEEAIETIIRSSGDNL